MLTRRGPAKVITAEEAREKLAIPCYYLIAGKAGPLFPTSSTPAPTTVVWLVPSKRCLQPPFPPVPIPLEQWREAVLPVVQSEEWDSRAPLIREAIRAGRLSQEVEFLGEDLYRSFTEAGYGNE